MYNPIPSKISRDEKIRKRQAFSLQMKFRYAQARKSVIHFKKYNPHLYSKRV